MEGRRLRDPRGRGRARADQGVGAAHRPRPARPVVEAAVGPRARARRSSRRRSRSTACSLPRRASGGARSPCRTSGCGGSCGWPCPDHAPGGPRARGRGSRWSRRRPRWRRIRWTVDQEAIVAPAPEDTPTPTPTPTQPTPGGGDERRREPLPASARQQRPCARAPTRSARHRRCIANPSRLLATGGSEARRRRPLVGVAAVPDRRRVRRAGRGRLHRAPPPLRRPAGPDAAEPARGGGDDRRDLRGRRRPRRAVRARRRRRGGAAALRDDGRTTVNARVTREEFARRIGVRRPTRGSTAARSATWSGCSSSSRATAASALDLQWGSYETKPGGPLVPPPPTRPRSRVSEDSDEQTLFQPVWVGYPSLQALPCAVPAVAWGRGPRDRGHRADDETWPAMPARSQLGGRSAIRGSVSGVGEPTSTPRPPRAGS